MVFDIPIAEFSGENARITMFSPRIIAGRR
jgi:hypothetical protein